MHWRHFLNVTRIARVIPETVPTEAEIFGAYFAKHGR
jgi:sulfoacetaldehyde dehydrogenase